MIVRETHRLTITGDTKGQKELLKRRGWKWDPATLSWVMMLVPEHAEKAALPGLEFVKRLIGHTKGCLIRLDGKTLWKSTSYVPANQMPVNDRPAKGDVWNTDAHGNYVATREIPGSDPMDRI